MVGVFVGLTVSLRVGGVSMGVGVGVGLSLGLGFGAGMGVAVAVAVPHLCSPCTIPIQVPQPQSPIQARRIPCTAPLAYKPYTSPSGCGCSVGQERDCGCGECSCGCGCGTLWYSVLVQVGIYLQE